MSFKADEVFWKRLAENDFYSHLACGFFNIVTCIT